MSKRSKTDGSPLAVAPIIEHVSDRITMLHEKVLYPIVRIRTVTQHGTAGGSGVLIYSKPDPQIEGDYINIVLTCEHVVDGAITMREEFDPLLKADRRIDVLEAVRVEVFDYAGSILRSANATAGTIIAYDKQQDMAAVRLKNPLPMPFVATMIPEAEIAGLRLFEPVYTSGCSIQHDPFANPGTLTYLSEPIDRKTYLMANAPAVFGNSGGGLFRGEGGDLLGLVSRVTLLPLGFGDVDVMTWMNFSTHPSRLYEFFNYHELQFLYDAGDDYYKAEVRRATRQKEALRSLMLGEKA